ncbi:hypothetical protein ACH95_04180 [Bacillus glycinifermentans]|uniref:DUF3221 domain-containing protein n=1 Tax=Bacillus glycinifermentans TaxID=1664069 RepID=A0A0J6E0Y5_9BACI|nr:hypothetical protein ACH95_04180 [Bacillus glycinifermentans]KRT95470.1 hypothetical protein AB447_209775 [Bacillus glycinifermentans]
MQRVFVLISVFAILAGSGCQTNKEIEAPEKGQSIVGYVMLKEGDRAILVESQHRPKKENYRLTEREIIQKYRNKVTVLGLSDINNKEELKQRQKVKVWLHMLKESNPPQATIHRFEKIKE